MCCKIRFKWIEKYSKTPIFIYEDTIQAVVDLAKKWLNAIPDAKIKPLLCYQENENQFILHWRAEGTLTGAIREIEATGKKVAFHGITNFRTKDGKVVEHWAAVDYRALKG